MLGKEVLCIAHRDDTLACLAIEALDAHKGKTDIHFKTELAGSVSISETPCVVFVTLSEREITDNGRTTTGSLRFRGKYLKILGGKEIELYKPAWAPNAYMVVALKNELKTVKGDPKESEAFGQAIIHVFEGGKGRKIVRAQKDT